ncbi:hypothetical protein [Candidatus Pantoea multigeneris]|uniref:Uncharacterized protein n=1 Tax=Candidatus Pantoea multigeneris TaxID=2608357 RepID=A0ABX0R8D2_9GAMM|nr:hypothetical protein [Pantoea multigeneris]NIF21623.1 hypothetical protein [Pantoea multigeneris]
MREISITDMESVYGASSQGELVAGAVGSYVGGTVGEDVGGAIGGNAGRAIGGYVGKTLYDNIGSGYTVASPITEGLGSFDANYNSSLGDSGWSQSNDGVSNGQ